MPIDATACGQADILLKFSRRDKPVPKLTVRKPCGQFAAEFGFTRSRRRLRRRVRRSPRRALPWEARPARPRRRGRPCGPSHGDRLRRPWTRRPLTWFGAYEEGRDKAVDRDNQPTIS